ncbi:hypothetical protein LVD15_11720 [Fulvivirga maritima]|uniref:hypothetical protein n=1 Tax=Fulvivirga maritima TaxID=2904247 RepID=UPI001F3FD788|nr:hypothetical protein [Fulvivirga maritima]UII29063.1 hypothetical protein LVD15_11720 [Fulvivirga maritima]
MNQFFRISAIVTASFLAFTACSDDDDDDVAPEEQQTPYEETLELVTNNSSKDWSQVKVIYTGEDETEECGLDDIYTFNAGLTWSHDINETKCSEFSEDEEGSFGISDDGQEIVISGARFELRNLTDTTMEFYTDADNISYFEAINK